MRKIILAFSFFASLLLAGLLLFEIQTSYFQSLLFVEQSSRMKTTLEDQKTSNRWYPDHGPTNVRLGYTQIPEWLERLSEFEVVKQATLNDEHLEFIKDGNNPIYNLETNKGLVLLDKNQEIFYDKRQKNQFASFEEIPSILVDILLFVENKNVLAEAPYFNPAIEYSRFVKASMAYLWNKVLLQSGRVAGGSTLATQMEKYNFSEDGKTASGKEKLHQIYSASLRAYLGGRDTSEARKKIVLDYFNSIPLGAAKGYGELHGFNEALEIFYGVDLKNELDLLRSIDLAKPTSHEQLESLNRALQIILAVRNPSFLNDSRIEKLNSLKNNYIDLMVDQKIIPYSSLLLKDQVEKKQAYSFPKKSFNQNKSQDLVRRRLSRILGTTNHDLDKLDLSANTTIDYRLQSQIELFFEKLKDPNFLDEHHLRVPKLLDQTNPENVIYSLTLYKLEDGEAKLRAIYDSQNQPFSFNDAGKVELGSSAKLRVIVSYLNAVKKAYEEKQESKLDKTDPISILVKNSAAETLEEVLLESLEKIYSASPNESFFTGGGIHRFGNYNEEDNSKVVTLKESFKRSINLPFVRALRDVVNFHKQRTIDKTNLSEEEKDRLLEKFIDKESKIFIEKYYRYFKARPELVIEDYLAYTLPKSMFGSAAVILWMNNQLTFEEFLGKLQLEQQKDGKRLRKKLAEFYKNFKAGIFGINDIGYLAKIHPLMIYVGMRLKENPDLDLALLLEESKDVRFETYKWLLKTRFEREQLKKIDIILEEEIFKQILVEWQSLGYPFKEVVPSLATALGSSGDTPASLAKLVGIIINDGRLANDRTIERLHFAERTPYEVHLEGKKDQEIRQVLDPTIAKVMRSVLKEVVDDGTAIRLKGSLKGLSIGGKTGTGDNRLEVHGSDGSVLDSKALSRTATFVFYIGENWFGNITVYVGKDEAETSSFTSSYPVALLKILGKEIEDFID